MSDPQRRADLIRNLVEEHDSVGRVGLEVLWAAGSDEDLALRARHHDRVITLERGPDWLTVEPHTLALELANELVTGALGTERPAIPAPLWRRALPHTPPAAS